MESIVFVFDPVVAARFGTSASSYKEQQGFEAPNAASSCQQYYRITKFLCTFSSVQVYCSLIYITPAVTNNHTIYIHYLYMYTFTYIPNNNSYHHHNNNNHHHHHHHHGPPWHQFPPRTWHPMSSSSTVPLARWRRGSRCRPALWKHGKGFSFKSG